VIIRQQGPASRLRQAIGKDIKGKISPVFYLAGILSTLATDQSGRAGGWHCPSVLRRRGDHVDRPGPPHRPDGQQP
jgi:hypothetical protein